MYLISSKGDDDDDDDDDDDNCFCGMVDWQKACCLISSRDHCQDPHHREFREFEPAQNLNSSLVEWNKKVVITTTYF